MATVKVVMPEGLREFPLEAALSMAEAEGLDLVLMNDKDTVCKIMNYSKYLYTQKKGRKPSKSVTVKEIKFGPGIAEHDLEVKLRNAEKMLCDGHRVKFIMQYRGRMTGRMQDGLEVMDYVVTRLAEVSKVYLPVKREGNNWVLVLEARKANR